MVVRKTERRKSFSSCSFSHQWSSSARLWILVQMECQRESLLLLVVVFWDILWMSSSECSKQSQWDQNRASGWQYNCLRCCAQVLMNLTQQLWKIWADRLYLSSMDTPVLRSITANTCLDWGRTPVENQTNWISAGTSTTWEALFHPHTHSLDWHHCATS